MKSLVKLIMPVAAFMLASAGAIGSATFDSDSAAVPVQGWKRIAPNVCSPTKVCNNESQALCYDGSNQMFSKPTQTSDCTGILYHKP